jgi:hypothetical protein
MRRRVDRGFGKSTMPEGAKSQIAELHGEGLPGRRRIDIDELFNGLCHDPIQSCVMPSRITTSNIHETH